MPLTLSEAIRRYVERAVVRNDGNVTKAARELGINRRSLQRWRAGKAPTGALKPRRIACERCR